MPHPALDAHLQCVIFGWWLVSSPNAKFPVVVSLFIEHPAYLVPGTKYWVLYSDSKENDKMYCTNKRLDFKTHLACTTVVDDG